MPGPWTWEKYANSYALVSETKQVGSVRQVVDVSYEGENAALIAAAPELLDALQDLVERDRAEAAESGFTDHEMKATCRAIAKAKGGVS